MKKIFKSKKGLTLIELVVGMVIFGIISTAVAASLAPTLFAFMRANEFAEYNLLLDNIANQILDDLSQSTEKLEPAVNDITITKHATKVRYTISDDSEFPEGILLRDLGGNLQPVFSEEFYRRKTVTFEFADVSTEDTAAYMLTIRLININEDFEIDRDYAVRPLILNQHTPTEDEDDG